VLALIAGRGKLPAVLVDSLEDLPFIASPEGFDPDFLVPDRRFRIEALGTLIEEMRALGVTEVCFAGGIRRPDIDPARIDAATRPLVPRILAALGQGDDGALRAVLSIFEEASFTIRAAHEILPALLPDAGVPTARRPDPADEADAARAAAIVAGMGDLDIGQAVAVLSGQALAVEGVFGTDWMLASLRHRPDGGGGLIYKAAKPGQDRRVDLPMIGTDTVTAAKRAGLDGIVVARGEVMVLDLDRVVRAADKAALFLWVR
jgi:UDP-2,3-diacylglucosamine hydrolase